MAPGRVNLIGEHIDYNGLPVLPIAIDRAVRIDFRVSDEGVVRLRSPVARFPPFSFRLKRRIETAERGDWSNYARAAAQGLMEHGIALRRGIEGTVSGDVPIASGLSSSSALVVASALALLKANGVTVGGNGFTGGAGVAPERRAATAMAHQPRKVSSGRSRASISRLELATLTARAERLVGLQGGGMDQAACLHGVEGHALRIEFEPLRVTPLAVPEGWRWLVASSLQHAEKSAGVGDMYNERARQCREALAGVAVGGGRAIRGPTYRDLAADPDLEGVLRRARRVLAPVLFDRFRHIVTEGRRVSQAEKAMRGGDMGRFGELMVQSHASLRDAYEVSTPELDTIVEVAMEAGAAGARLTGAGFGGCAVVLCARRTVAHVMDSLAARFYAPRLGGAPGPDVIFAVRPEGGAEVEGWPPPEVPMRDPGTARAPAARSPRGRPGTP